MSVSTQLVRLESVEMGLDLKPNDRRRRIGQILLLRSGVHVRSLDSDICGLLLECNGWCGRSSSVKDGLAKSTTVPGEAKSRGEAKDGARSLARGAEEGHATEGSAAG